MPIIILLKWDPPSFHPDKTHVQHTDIIDATYWWLSSMGNQKVDGFLQKNKVQNRDMYQLQKFPTVYM